MNRELPDVQTGFKKSRGTRDQIANIHWIIKNAREFQKTIYFCFIDYAQAFDYVDHNKLWKILKEMGIPDTTWPAYWEICMQVNKQQLELDMEQWTRSKSGKDQGCRLSPWLFNSYAEYIMWNAGLDEAQAGIKLAWRNINNFRYANDTTVLAESKE